MRRSFHIREMVEADLAMGMRLKGQAGWNQTDEDWRRFLWLSPGGCFLGCVGDQPAATVTTVRFGPVGWIGMVLVDVDHRGRGYGQAMLGHAVEHLRGRVETIRLNATEQGRPLYEKLGFRAEYGLTRFEYHPGGAHGKSAEIRQDGGAVGPEDLDRILDLDRVIYGSDRSPLWRRLWEEGHPILAVEVNERVAGYATLRPGANAAHFGPAVARTERARAEILDWLRERVRGTCFLDVPDVSAHRNALIDELGLVRQRDFVRMYLGNEPIGGEPIHVLATSGAEKG